MAYFNELNILEIFEKEAFLLKKVDAVRKQAALQMFECLSFSLGKSFELYLSRVFPHILSNIADGKEIVRTAALEALKVITANYSNYAIKQALPQFLKELENDNWRSKRSTIEALGNMAFCAPK